MSEDQKPIQENETVGSELIEGLGEPELPASEFCMPDGSPTETAVLRRDWVRYRNALDEVRIYAIARKMKTLERIVTFDA